MKSRRLSKKDLARIAKGQLPAPTEDETQSVIVEGMQAHGYLVLVTSRRVKKCWSCGNWPRSGKGDGVSKGLADLQIRHPTWPVGLWMAMEVKREGQPVKWSNLEQKAFAAAGDIVVVRSLEESLLAARAVDRVLKGLQDAID